MSKEPANTGNEQKSVKPKVRSLLNKYKWFWWGNAAGPYGVTGISDTSAFKAGVFMAIESKYEGGGHTLSARQIGFLNSISMEQGFAFVVNQNNLGHLETFLRNFGLAAAMVQRGKKVGPDKGGPMLEAIKALTDYPISVEAYAQEKVRLRNENDDEGVALHGPGDPNPGDPGLGGDVESGDDPPLQG